MDVANRYSDTENVKRVRTQYKADIEKYGFKLGAPVCDKSMTAKLYYIRHGLSEHNYTWFKGVKDAAEKDL